MHDAPRAARFLEGALLANVLVHVLAILTMALCLLPGMPGGPTTEAANRAAYIATHPWLWRLGWVPWNLCALCNLITGIALVATPWVPRLPAMHTFILTLGAVLTEQLGEIAW